MGRRRPDWWSEQQQQQQQQQQQHRDQQRHQEQRGQQDLSDDGCPRNAANARERARMRVLSKAFSRLKTTLPWVPADTKLSKLDTLRLATTYIAHLSSLLTVTERPDAAAASDRTTAAAPAPVDSSSHPPPYLPVTWPYNAHHGVKGCSSPEDDYRYDCTYSTTLEQKSYSAYDCAYYTTASSINS